MPAWKAGRLWVKLLLTTSKYYPPLSKPNTLELRSALVLKMCIFWLQIGKYGRYISL